MCSLRPAAHSFRYAFLVGLSLVLGTVPAFAAAPVVGNITTAAGTMKGFSGDRDQATAAQLDGASGVVVDAAGNVYIADTNNHRVRKIGPGGIITTYAGNTARRAFPGTAARQRRRVSSIRPAWR